MAAMDTSGVTDARAVCKRMGRPDRTDTLKVCAPFPRTMFLVRFAVEMVQ